MSKQTFKAFLEAKKNSPAVKYKLDPNDQHVQKLMRAIVSIWNGIAPDADPSGKMKNAHALEVSLDGDRLAMDGRDEENEILRTLQKDFGYDKVDRFLNKHVKLV